MDSRSVNGSIPSGTGVDCDICEAAGVLVNLSNNVTTAPNPTAHHDINTSHGYPLYPPHELTPMDTQGYPSQVVQQPLSALTSIRPKKWGDRSRASQETLEKAGRLHRSYTESKKIRRHRKYQPPYQNNKLHFKQMFKTFYDYLACEQAGFKSDNTASYPSSSSYTKSMYKVREIITAVEILQSHGLESVVNNYPKELVELKYFWAIENKNNIIYITTKRRIRIAYANYPKSASISRTWQERD